MQGTFNPEVFTAALGPVIQHYRSGDSAIDAVYTDARTFFTEATYPTEGLKQTVSSVFRRIAGDMNVPSILRMETAFGGGKTHSLIACVHIANLGTELADVTSGILDPQYLPQPHSIAVVGIAGDEIPVRKTKGDRLTPYTLWGELAWQLGGPKLYQKVKDDAESFAAPGENFFKTVLADGKTLIMMDELAQYAARLEAALPGRGASQLAAFLMSLVNYARSRGGIAIVVTLAGAADAFSQQTEFLKKLLEEMGGGTMDSAVVLAQDASREAASVIQRDATAVTPVQASEISAVLAKRLFEFIDRDAAVETVGEYAEVYRRNPSLLPNTAMSVNCHDRMIENYPFHPALIDFLNNKLAQAANFQGTRGVLRTLAMTVRNLWNKDNDGHRCAPIGLIHVSDIDMRSSAIVNELLGRTGNASLRQVLNADVGSVDTPNLQGGMSNAQIADARNPHPDGLAFYEMTWKTVFLNSLVGEKRDGVFGVSQQDAVFQLASPLLAPSQIVTALDEISESAFYLRFEDGKYFAHVEPTINSILARIRSSIDDGSVRRKLKDVSSRLITDNRSFHVEHDVSLPQDIPDGREAPTLASISLSAGEIRVADMFQMKGDAAARVCQNTILLLVPKNVRVICPKEGQLSLDMDEPDAGDDSRMISVARQVLAIEMLKRKPEDYGVAAAKLQDAEFVEKARERSNALQTVVSEMYNCFYYCSQNGFERRELRPMNVESGTTIWSQIIKILQDAGKLVYSETGVLGVQSLKSLAENYFFKASDRMSCADIHDHFLKHRSWPMLTNRETLEQLMREGVNSGCWVAYKNLTDPTDTQPAEFYSQEIQLPLTVQLLKGDYSLMTLEGARKRGWGKANALPNEKVREAVLNILSASGADKQAATVENLTKEVQAQYANATDAQVMDVIGNMAKNGGFALYEGQAHQKTRPDELLSGLEVSAHNIRSEDVVISKASIIERGWHIADRGVEYFGTDGAERIKPILKNIGSLYTRGGAASRVDLLDISDMKMSYGNATIRVVIENATADDMKNLGEFFDTLMSVAKFEKNTEAEIKIEKPGKNCALIKKLKE